MYLPEDLILGILLRLPVISLLRFKCVGKKWCSLIKSSTFSDNYLALRHAMDEGDDLIVLKHRNMSGCECCNSYKIFASRSCYGDYDSLLLALSVSKTGNYFPVSGHFPEGMTVINHVNGILCVFAYYFFSITLLNPSIREVRELSDQDFDLNCYTQGLGFGFDVATNDYKVVRIVTVFKEEGRYPYHHQHEHVGLVYRLSTNTWTISGELPAFVSEYYQDSENGTENNYFLGWDHGPQPCVFSHGSVHWLVTGKNRVLAFNLTNELFGEIRLPHALKDYDQSKIVYKLFNVERSTIALVAYTDPYEVDRFSGPQLMDVWVMKEYGVTESWTKQYSIKALPEIVRPLCFWRRDKLVFQATTNNWNLICYDLSKGLVYQPYGPCLIGVDVETCNESLVSIKL